MVVREVGADQVQMRGGRERDKPMQSEDSDMDDRVEKRAKRE